MGFLNQNSPLNMHPLQRPKNAQASSEKGAVTPANNSGLGQSFFKDKGFFNKSAIDRTIFHGKTDISGAEVERELKKLKSKIIKYKLQPNQLEEIKNMFLGPYGPRVTRAKLKIMTDRLSQEMAHMDSTKLTEIRAMRNKINFIKDIGGIK